MKRTIMNGKRYTVNFTFNMVGNWDFTDKYGNVHLVDAQDVSEWADEENIKWDGINTAIAYAKYISSISADGSFWWTVKTWEVSR